MITSPIWLPATLFAGAVQAWRTALQKRVSQSLSVNAAGLVRYLYGLPFALMMLGVYQWAIFPGTFPALGRLFLLFCLAGGLAQIIASPRDSGGRDAGPYSRRADRPVLHDYAADGDAGRLAVL